MPTLRGVEFNSTPARRAMGLPHHWTPSVADDVSSVTLFRECDRADLARIVDDCDAPLETRVAAGSILSLAGDLRIVPHDPNMIDILGGQVMIGTPPTDVPRLYADHQRLGVKREWIEKEVPQHRVELQPYRLGKFPVTNIEYKAFLRENPNGAIPASWKFGRYPTWDSNHPVHGIPTCSIQLYVEWLSRRTRRHFRLPTEAEWEHAAAGHEGLEYPWGEAFVEDHANTAEAGILHTTPVGLFPKGRTASGLYDLAGNVEEYVQDEYAAYPGGKLIQDDLYSANPHYRMTRGGSFARFRDLARCRRRHGHIDREIYVIGFRLAETIVTS